MAKIRSRRQRVGFFVAGLLSVSMLALASAPAGAAETDYTEPSFFFDGKLQAAPLFTIVERPGFLLSPILTTNLLEADAYASSQNERRSLASLFEPGPLGAFPGLLPMLGLPALPYPGYPLTVAASPDQPEAHVGLGSVPAGAPDNVDGSALAAGALFAQATADQAEARGQSYAGAFGLGSGVLSVEGITADSRMVARSPLQGTTKVKVSGIKILGGLVRIGALESTTTITADGSSPSKSVSTIKVADVTALDGLKATIDETGVRIVGVPGLPGLPSTTVIADLNKQLADQLRPYDLEIKLFGNAEATAPADATAAAVSEGRGLLIKYALNPLPGVPIPNIPGVPISLPIGNGVPDIITINVGYTSGKMISGAAIDLSSLGDLAGLGDGLAESGGFTDGTGMADAGSLPLESSGSADLGSADSSGALPGIADGSPGGEAPVAIGENGPGGRTVAVSDAALALNILPAFPRVFGLAALAFVAALSQLGAVRRRLDGLDIRRALAVG